MSWVKLDDQYPDHPKIMRAGPIAAWMHTCGLCYCARLLTDGFIPDAQIRKLADLGEANCFDVASHLVEAKLWQKCDGGYMIHDYLQYNPSRSHVEDTRAKRAEAGVTGGTRSGEARREAKSKQIACCDASTNMNPVPVPLPESRTKVKDESRASRFIPPDPKEIIAFFKANGSNNKEAKLYYDHYQSNGWKVGQNKMKDWHAAARGWITRAEDFSSNGKQPESHKLPLPDIDADPEATAYVRRHTKQ